MLEEISLLYIQNCFLLGIAAFSALHLYI